MGKEKSHSRACINADILHKTELVLCPRILREAWRHHISPVSRHLRHSTLLAPVECDGVVASLPILNQPWRPVSGSRPSTGTPEPSGSLPPTSLPAASSAGQSSKGPQHGTSSPSISTAFRGGCHGVGRRWLLWCCWWAEVVAQGPAQGMLIILYTPH